MSRSKSDRRPVKVGRDLWKPGPMSGQSHTADNKRLDRRIARKRAKAALLKEPRP